MPGENYVTLSVAKELLSVTFSGNDEDREDRVAQEGYKNGFEFTVYLNDSALEGLDSSKACYLSVKNAMVEYSDDMHYTGGKIANPAGTNDGKDTSISSKPVQICCPQLRPINQAFATFNESTLKDDCIAVVATNPRLSSETDINKVLGAKDQDDNIHPTEHGIVYTTYTYSQQHERTTLISPPRFSALTFRMFPAHSSAWTDSFNGTEHTSIRLFFDLCFYN